MTLTELKPTFRPILELFSVTFGRFSLEGGGSRRLSNPLSIYDQAPYFPFKGSGPIFHTALFFHWGLAAEAKPYNPPPLPSAGCWACQITVSLAVFDSLAAPASAASPCGITVFLLHFPSKSFQKSMSEICFKFHCQKMSKTYAKIEPKWK